MRQSFYKLVQFQLEFQEHFMFITFDYRILTNYTDDRDSEWMMIRSLNLSISTRMVSDDR